MAIATFEAPSLAEVERAICDLLTSNWFQPLMNFIGYRTDLSVSSSSGSEQSRVFDVFQLLQMKYILRMVVSVATDKAVWEAIMANKEVSAFVNSVTRFFSIGEGKAKGNGKERDMGMMIFEWVKGIGKAIIDDFIKRFNLFLDKMYKPSNNNKNQKQNAPSSNNNKNQIQDASSSPEECDFTLRSTYFISCIVFFIVVVTRAYGF